MYGDKTDTEQKNKKIKKNKSFWNEKYISKVYITEKQIKQQIRRTRSEFVWTQSRKHPSIGGAKQR